MGGLTNRAWDGFTKALALVNIGWAISLLLCTKGGEKPYRGSISGTEGSYQFGQTVIGCYDYSKPINECMRLEL